MSMPTADQATRERREALLWVVVFAGPVLWIIHLALIYPLVPLACNMGWGDWPFHLATVLTGLGTLGAVVLAWRLLSSRSAAPAVPDGALQQRQRFMAFVGVVLSMLFFIVIIAEGFPVLLLSPCVRGWS